LLIASLLCANPQRGNFFFPRQPDGLFFQSGYFQYAGFHHEVNSVSCSKALWCIPGLVRKVIWEALAVFAYKTIFSVACFMVVVLSNTLSAISAV
jgi:hypothetical protein